jgi:hypothetical protein
MEWAVRKEPNAINRKSAGLVIALSTEGTIALNERRQAVGAEPCGLDATVAASLPPTTGPTGQRPCRQRWAMYGGSAGRPVKDDQGVCTLRFWVKDGEPAQWAQVLLT